MFGLPFDQILEKKFSASALRISYCYQIGSSLYLRILYSHSSHYDIQQLLKRSGPSVNLDVIQQVHMPSDSDEPGGVGSTTADLSMTNGTTLSAHSARYYPPSLSGSLNGSLTGSRGGSRSTDELDYNFLLSDTLSSSFSLSSLERHLQSGSSDTHCRQRGQGMSLHRTIYSNLITA